MPLPIKRHLDESSFATKMVSKKDIMENFDEYQKTIAFWRWYPDLFVDFMVKVSGPDCTFKLYPYQRLMLRALARYNDVNMTFSRGTSKSFINILWQIIKGILYPGTRSAICASTKGQSAKILDQKIAEIRALIPAFNFELKKEPSKVKDDITVLFKNSSWIMNVAAKGSTRGDRQNALTTEEIIECDPENMESVVRPLLAISRLAANGQRDPNEAIKRQEVIITTAGTQGSYSYSRLIRNLIRMVTEPGKAIVIGGSYRIPIIAGLQDMDWIREMKMSGTFNPASFPREFLSLWSAGSETAYFPADAFDKCRALQEPEFERASNLGKNVEYFFSIDVGRYSDTSEVTVIKRIPQIGAPSMKHIVNIVTFENMAFPEQAVNIKKLYMKYRPICVTLDANGVGAGLVDELVLSQIDPENGMYLAPWGIRNDENGQYLKFKTTDTIPDLLYLVKATAPFNTQMYSNLQTQLLTNKIRFLVDEGQAKLRLEASRAKKFKEMSIDDKADYMLPFYQTSALKMQMLNLESQNEGTNIILKRTNNKIKKDKVSSLGYGLWVIKTEYDDREVMRKSITLDQMMKLGTSGARQTNKLANRLTFRGNHQYTSPMRRSGKF